MADTKGHRLTSNNKLAIKGFSFTITAFTSILLTLSFASIGHSDELRVAQSTIGGGKSVRIIEPKKDVPVAKAAAIDDERFELGVFSGFLAVEEFNTNMVFGAAFTYHINEHFIGQIQYANSEVDKASFESINNFLSDEQRDFTYYSLLGGYRLLRGRSFFGKKDKYNSDIYVLAGIGSVDYGRTSSNNSFVVGASYRVVLTDSLVANLDFRGHAVDGIEISADDSQSTFNTEVIFGLNLLF